MYPALRAALAGVLLLLAGASVGCVAARCSIAGPDWPDHVGPWLPGIEAYPSHAMLRVGRKGELDYTETGFNLGGEPWRISRADLSKVLTLIDSPGGPTYLVLDVSPEAPCGLVKSLAREVQALAKCRAGACIEKAAWENYRGAA